MDINASNQASTSQPTNTKLKADSLSVLLSQALKSTDKQLLENAINTGDERVINNTVRLLSAAESASFLKVTVQLLHKKPSRGHQLVIWIRAVLLHHTAYLASAPGALAPLAALYQTIEDRLALSQPLLSLAGRLELVVGQLNNLGGTQQAGHLEVLGNPLVYYEESDTDKDDGDAPLMLPAHKEGEHGLEDLDLLEDTDEMESS